MTHSQFTPLGIYLFVEKILKKHNARINTNMFSLFYVFCYLFSPHPAFSLTLLLPPLPPR